MNALGREKYLALAIRYGLLLLGMLIVVIPFIYMVSVSFKPQAYTFEMPPRLFPSEITLGHYQEVFAKEHLLIYFGNSLFIAVISTAGTLFISSLLAYAFARMDFKGKNIL